MVSTNTIILDIIDDILDIYDQELDGYTWIQHYTIKIGGYIKYFDLNGIKKGFGILVKIDDTHIYLKNIQINKIYKLYKNKYFFFYKPHVSINNDLLSGDIMRDILYKYDNRNK